MPLVVPSSRRPFVSRLLKKISFLGHGKRLPVMMELHPDALVDLRGLPGDAPSDVPKAMTAIAGLMEADNISWCVAGDLLLLHYRVPLATHVRRMLMIVYEIRLTLSYRISRFLYLRSTSNRLGTFSTPTQTSFIHFGLYTRTTLVMSDHSPVSG